ncbi:MAG: leucine-rich repeat protein [Paludibacteraceae bacterium]|nr:leucine-rich repeat protein [Paludibacteraceae bacterium]
MIKKILLLLFLCATSALHAANYLTFTAEADSSAFGIHSEWGNNPDVQYSLDGGKTWTKLTNDTLIPLPNKKKALLRGYNPQGISRDFGEVTHFVMTGRIAASGSVMSLIDNVGESVVIPNSSCFQSLFDGCASLTQAPELPAIYLTDKCYAWMFLGCTNLKEAPQLPAMQLTGWCYRGMFSKCTSLTEAPKLPATQLEICCYNDMFSGCTSLTEAPILPATQLQYSCYAYMFSKCTSLTHAPQLPATQLAMSCYQGMFSGCSSLTAAPELPAIQLQADCYHNMFNKCTNLTKAPQLPATSLADGCYYGMFMGCTSLTKTPELPATTLTNWCYREMFMDCTGLTEASQIPEDHGHYYTYDDMYKGCTNLPPTFQLIRKTPAPKQEPTINSAELFPVIKGFSPNKCLTFTAESDNVQISIENKGQGKIYPNVQYSTNGGKKWKVLRIGEQIKLLHKGDKALLRGYNPQGFSFAPDSYIRFVMTGRAAASGSVMSLIDGIGECQKIPNDYCFACLFDSCASLTQAPELPATQLTEGCYMKMFLGCTNLKVAPQLPATQLARGCYSRMFSECTSLTEAPELPATQLDEWCYVDMFKGCTSLTEAPQLPATQTFNGCYNNMFKGCTSLTEAPQLPAIQLTRGCYFSMFDSCTSLTKAPELPATIMVSECYARMFKGCVNLKEAPELPAKRLSWNCYLQMFVGCTQLEQAPELPADVSFEGCYQEMFAGCSSLKEAPQLPAPFMTKDCYRGMFKGCTSLTQAPALNATRLVDGCYTEMFEGCTGLKEIPQLPEISLDYRKFNQSKKGYKTGKSIVSLGNDTIRLYILSINWWFKQYLAGTNFKLEDNGILKIPDLKGKDRFMKCEGHNITNFTVSPLSDNRFYLESVDIATLPTDKEVKLTTTSPEGELLAEVKIHISRPTFYLKINDQLVKIDSASVMPSFKEEDNVSFVVFDENGKEMEVTHRDIKTKGAPPIGSKLIEKGGELSIPEKKWILSSPHNPFEIYIMYKNEEGKSWQIWIPFFRGK